MTRGQNDPAINIANQDREQRSIARARFRMSDAAFNKFCVFCGPISQLLFFLFLPASLQLPPISPGFDQLTTRDHYIRNETGMKGGIALMLMTAVTWPFFVAVVNRQLARIPGINPTVLWAQVASGSVGSISMMYPSMFFAATIYRLDRDPALTQLLSDIAWFVFAMGYPPFIAQDLAISYGILSDKRKKPLIPHWVAWVNTAQNFLFAPSLGLHCVKHGAIAWNGALTFWVGAAAFGNQIGLLVGFLLKAIGRPDDEDDDESQESGSQESEVKAA